jgi:hypothetical protein
MLQVVVSLLLCGFALALPNPNEELQPCGAAFYSPSNVLHSLQLPDKY